MYVITEINEYMLPKIQRQLYSDFDTARGTVLLQIQARGLSVRHEAGPENATEGWREGWIRVFNTTDETPMSWLISEVN